MGQGWQLDQNLPSLQEFGLRRNYSRPQSASRWNSEQDSSRLWQKRKKHEKASCKKEKQILVCRLRRVGSSHKKLKNFVQRRPWALASFDVFSMLHWSMFHTDRNIGWPCETCSTVALFCCSSRRPFGAGTDIWSGLRPLVRSFIVPLARSCSLMWKNMKILHQLQLQLEYFLHTFHSFFTMLHAFQWCRIWNSSCLNLFVAANIRVYIFCLVPKPGETTLLQDELQETKERSKELQATVMAVVTREPCEECPRHQDTRTPLQVAQIEAQKRLEKELLRWRLRH